ncbi:putative universal stress protein UspA [Campylobacter blaseri]|uniref:Universal stress protein n=1 Tax=Campylobacter blaseri TaxID=2042961 RepID=A0A2P8R3Y4_9BACT|nr:universal stress protein [Campylobacter blaseri]PSM53210.1 universal stress protein [Campylobacter blaseri]PSM54676.1 universal stress protein [Campylobacter blaseri]QKF86847.1 putative universal stress protein UspA [Campylobacter blaseri]
MKKVLVFIDGLALSKSVCEYGIGLAKALNLPLLLLSIAEQPTSIDETNLSGSLSIGTKDRLLDKLAAQEHAKAKEDIRQNREILSTLKEFAINSGVKECQTLQRHGTLSGALEDFHEEIRVVVVGIRGSNEDDDKLGYHIEELIRSSDLPILVVPNSEYSPINSLLMAYDSSEFSKKAFEVALSNPIFPNTKRYIVNVNSDEALSNTLLKEAGDVFKDKGFEFELKHLNGDPVIEILKYEDEIKADAIAMGAYSKNRIKNFFLGSFTSKMLLNSKKPLLLFR